jgi:hypothetical protein
MSGFSIIVQLIETVALELREVRFWWENLEEIDH